MTLLVKNGHVFTLNDKDEDFDNGAVFIGESGAIVELGPSEEMCAKYEKEADEVLDAKGGMIAPAFICAHGHFYGVYSRGMDMKDDPPSNFLEVLERLWWRLDRGLDESTNRHSTLICLVDAIRSGTTTIFDHHASPYCTPGSLDTIEKACKDAGVRASLCYEISERNGEEEFIREIDENIRYALKLKEEMKDEKMPQFAATVGLHSCLTLSDDGLKTIREKVTESGLKDIGFHVHVGEGPDDEIVSMKKFGKRSIERLDAAGMLNPHSICCHCVAIDDKERDLVKKADAVIVHNPSSNMNNGVGALDVPKTLDAGVLAGLGTDGIGLDMIKEYYFAYMLQKLAKGHPSAGSMEAFNLLFKNNSKIASRHFGYKIGVLEPGAVGDVIVLDYYTPTSFHGGNLPWHVIAGSMEAFNLLFKNNSKIASRHFGYKIGVLEPGAVGDVIVLDYYTPTSFHGGNLPWHVMFGMGSRNVSSTISRGKVLMRERELVTLDEKKIMAEAKAEHMKVWEKVWEIAEKEKKERKEKEEK
ncbi:protein ssnA, putative [Aduncisulcus paluster]|uniref:Protein ssnA, putative n=1 Tax=Aduncisulcus paluster TaxID=2918883 RepID=A0ABQ5K3N4_9EUKA|nr:protein ssnA, putative [Aduncisulcus paluster]